MPWRRLEIPGLLLGCPARGDDAARMLRTSGGAELAKAVEAARDGDMAKAWKESENAARKAAEDADALQRIEAFQADYLQRAAGRTERMKAWGCSNFSNNAGELSVEPLSTRMTSTSSRPSKTTAQRSTSSGRLSASL